MDRWKSDNYETGGERLTSRASLSRRLIGLAGVAALTVGGAGAVLLGGGEAFAGPSVSYTNNFTVGTTTVGGVTFSAASLAQGATTTYTVGFTIPSTEPAGNVPVTLSGMPDTAVSTATAAITITDVSTGISYGVTANGFAATTAGSGTLTIPAADYTAGNTMSVQIVGLTNGLTSSNPFTPTVGITGYLAGSAAAVNLTGATVTPTLTVSSATPGAGGVTYTYSAATGLGTAPGTIYVGLTSSATAGTTPAVFPSASSSYTVTDTTTGATVPLATTTPITVTAGATGATPTPAYVKIALGTNTIANTDLISVTVAGVVNPSEPGTYGGAVTPGVPTNTVGSETVGIGTSLTAATLAISPATQGNTSAVYSVSFKVPASDLTPSTETITSAFTDSNGVTIATSANWAIFDATNSAGDSAGVAAPPTFNANVAAGDSVTVDYYNEANTSAASVSAAVSTSNYSVAVTTNAVSLALASTTAVYPTVSLGSATAGAVTTYTLGDFVVPTGGVLANTAIGVAVGTGTGGLGTSFAGATGFTFPANSVNYTLTDLTNSAASGATVSAITSAGFTLTNTNALAAGDKIQITVTGVTNSLTAGTNYMFSVTGLASGSVGISTPNAGLTYSNGALVQSGGQIDVIAGGYAFGIPSFSTYQTIAGMLGTTVVSGSFPTATAPRAGTLIQPVGSAGVWVVGTNGMIYQFSSASQLTTDGYSFMNVIPVPSAAGLTAGTGVPPTAAVTTPDGALVQYGTTIYVYAGGTPFGIPTFANYQTIAAATGTMVVQGSGTTPVASATTANGVLVQPIGTAGIWVTYNGSLYPFSTPAQLTGDGYSFNYVVPVPNTGSLTIA